ncbi:MAG: hypothetical protein INH37_16420, partial [Myxococcaceae bacterium]|nr:hypothetical protein [Myxococcaceae bacterium]
WWSVDLPATPDLAEHRTHVTPPLDAPGAYLVAASTLESFAERDNLILGVVFIVTDLVMTTTGLGGAADVIVRSGATGAPVAGVEVTLYEDPYERPPRVAQRVMTDAAGHARLEDPANPESDHFIVAKKGASLALDPRSPDLWVDHPTGDTESALLWTDRAVYRPGQTVHWKAVSWGAGPGRARAAGAGDDLGVRPGVPLTVSLLDANTVTAATTTVTTNAFGSASGTFTIPRGRGLGRWTLTASGAWQTIRVEEYKRPTFEVSFVDTKGALALGAKVTVRGEARSLFGLPVSAGLARWRVRREPVYPWWYGWWSPPREEPLVAAGVTPLSTDGSFALDFTPALDATKPADVAYRFVVEVDVTREGGETRSASRVVTLGVRSMQASFSADDGFLTEGRPATVKVRRATLDGEGRAGAGTWRLLALTPPAAPVMWDDEAPAPNPFAPRPRHTTPGDEQPPRAGAGPDVGATLRRWPDGRPVASGPLRHDATGEALVPLPPLTAGAYRLRYATVDEAGGAVEVATELVVAGPSAFPLAVPAWLRAERATSEVGSTARFLVGSAFPGQPLLFEVFRGAELVEQRWLVAGRDPAIVERPTTREDRGGFTVRVSLVRDWLVGSFSEAVSVPWSDAQLSLELSSFRDTLTPGATERFTVVVKRAGQRLGAGGAELLASMYDRSLDAITPFEPPRVSALRRERGGPRDLTTSVEAGDALVLGGLGWDQPRASGRDFDDDDGGRGRPLARRFTTIQIIKGDGGGGRPTQVDEETGARLRATFAETAFFTPHLEVNERGEASFEVPVPDSVTGWALWVSAVTKDLAGGELRASARSVKALMVRPSLPRFLREGDAAALKVVVDNASAKDLTGEVRVALLDPATQRDVSAEFGVSGGPLPFSAKAGQGAAVTVPLVAPRRVGEVLVKVVATSGDTSDGELHTLPLLPSRLRQSPSRLVALEGASTRTLSFEAAAGGPDPSRVDEQLVVTVDAQLLASVLAALPYLARYPYECTEQTLNRFLSASLVASALRGRPALARLAADLAKRKTPLERFDAPDPNLALGLEETPWLLEARGGDDGADVARLLDPDVVERERVAALRKLEGMQLDSGAFAWFAGGPASPDMTLYLLRGLARASEAGAEMPRYMVSEAWRFLSAHWRDEASRCLPTQRCDLAFVTALAHAATAFPDASWLAGGLRTDERRALLDYAMKHEGQLTPYLRGLLALALSRSRRGAEARQVFDAVMATARTTPDDGTFWPPPARPWVWHQDPIESHAFALRVLLELAPKDPRRAGLVKWLLLRKQLGHWKSTRATAEAIAALVEYLKTEQALEMREETTVTVGASTRQLIFEPGEVTGRRQQVVVPGSDLAGARWPTVTVSKATPGLQFAAATWHFSTERLPETGDGDLLQVRRTYFKRDTRGGETTLQPLAEGARLEPGDQLEVHLTLRARQEAEYLHLRDPRGAGFEPEVSLSRHRYEAGLSWYEEVRDSGTNFFLERVPAGEFTLRYRLRAAMGGTFRVGPATLQSIYAPEFSASSAGQRLVVGTGGR